MVQYHANDLRKISGGKKGKNVKVKRKYLMGGYPTETRLSDAEKRKLIRTKGGGIKVKLLSAAHANIAVDRGFVKRVRVLSVISNPSSKDYDRRKIVTKGAIIRTEIGLAKVTSRVGQNGVLNAVLIKEE